MAKRDRKIERRKYIRLDSVFPVDFRLVAQDNKTFLSDWIQGFINNISRVVERWKPRQPRLSLSLLDEKKITLQKETFDNMYHSGFSVIRIRAAALS